MSGIFIPFNLKPNVAMTGKKIIFLLMVISAGTAGFSQIYTRPNYGIKSHETLEINRIEVTEQNTVIYLSIENKITGGYFCTDKRTYLIYPDGTRMRMTRAAGIPYCPELHKFYSVGEKLHFELIFPPLSPGTKWIDMVEQCGGNCYWVYGIILDNELNRRLDEVFRITSSGRPEENILVFRQLLGEVDSLNSGIEGMLYYNIINAALEAGDTIEAGVWYKRLSESDAPRKEQYLKLLNDRGIKF